MKNLSSVFRLRGVFSSVLILISFALMVLFTGLLTETTSHAQDERSPSAVRFIENFDAVTAPALPAGWTTSRTGSNSLFVTTEASPDTPPQALFTNNPA